MQDKRILITGASTGIGFDLTTLLLAQGSYVVACARDVSNLEKLNESRLIAHKLDVTEISDIANIAELISEKYGYLDILILNAGTCAYIEKQEFSSKRIRLNFEVNFFGAINCIEAMLPMLKKSSSPHIAATSSLVTKLPIPRAEGYGASKAALTYFFECFAAHHLNEISISIISPGFVATPLTAKNTFPMPFLLTSDKAAKIIYKGLVKKKLYITFPLRLRLLFTFINNLPNCIKLNMLNKTVRKN